MHDETPFLYEGTSRGDWTRTSILIDPNDAREPIPLHPEGDSVVKVPRIPLFLVVRDGSKTVHPVDFTECNKIIP